MANLRPENADFGLEKAEMSSWRADLRPRNEDEEIRIFLYGIIDHRPLQVLQ